MPSIGVRFLYWISATALIVAGLVGLIGAQKNISSIGNQWLLVLITLTAAWSALQSSVPGQENRRLVQWASLGLFILWGALTLGRWVQSPQTPDAHFICAVLVFLAGGVALLPLRALIRNAFAVKPKWTGALAGLAAAAAVMLGLNLICLYEHPAHVFVWHVTPVGLLVAFGAFLNGFWKSKHHKGGVI